MNVCNKMDSSITHNIAKSFISLPEILKSQSKNTQEKSAAWRQQSLFVNYYLEKNFGNDLVTSHWIEHYSHSVNNATFHKDIDSVLNNHERLEYTIVFPTIEDFNMPSSAQTDNEMFSKPCLRSYLQKNGTRDYVGQSISNGIEITKEELYFCTGRQLLAAKTLKEQIRNDGVVMDHRNLTNNFQTHDVSFNFLATKKSLGSSGHLLNNRKTFVSPIRNNSITMDANSKCDEKVNSGTSLMLSHPALTNVDPKMVELINNEIVHKFKAVDWSEIAGLDYAKSVIKEAVVYPLLRPDIFTGLRRPPRGILLFGPPGTGKTLIGKCIASQSNSTFFSISSASLTSKWMGDGEKMVRALFAVAAARQPSVIFIDEIDSLLSQRSENENEGTRRLKTEFLVRFDGAATSGDDRVLIVGATNRPQELDEAVRRRFVKRLYVPLPDVVARAEILTNLLKTVVNNLDTCQIKEISKLAEGYSCSDIDSLCREASMEPLRSLPADAIMTFHEESLRHVIMEDFYIALKKIRPSVSKSDLNQYVEWNEIFGSSFK